MAEPSLSPAREEGGRDSPGAGGRAASRSREANTVSPARPVPVASGGGQVPLARGGGGAQPRSRRPSGAWSPATTVPRSLGPGRRSLGLGHPGPRRQGCQEPSGGREALLPAQGDEENATFVSCSHLALAARGRGGQRRPLRLGPAHREFLKDAHGCREDGRRGRGGWAGPPNPPPGRGAGRVGEGGGSRSVWPLSGRPEGDAGSRAGPGASPGASPPCAQAARPGRHVAGGPPARGIEAALFPRRALPAAGQAAASTGASPLQPTPREAGAAGLRAGPPPPLCPGPASERPPAPGPARPPLPASDSPRPPYPVLGTQTVAPTTWGPAEMTRSETHTARHQGRLPDPHRTPHGRSQIHRFHQGKSPTPGTKGGPCLTWMSGPEVLRWALGFGELSDRAALSCRHRATRPAFGPFCGQELRR